MPKTAVLAALASSSPDKAARFAALAPGLRIHDSYDALLADPDIDAVYIPLPNALHVDWTEKACPRGQACADGKANCDGVGRDRPPDRPAR